MHLLLFIRLNYLTGNDSFFYLILFLPRLIHILQVYDGFHFEMPQPHCSFPSMLLMSQTKISDIPSFWSSSQFHATVANYSICPILIGLLRLTVANQSECRICQFSLRSDSTLMNLTVAKIDHGKLYASVYPKTDLLIEFLRNLQKYSRTI